MNELKWNNRFNIGVDVVDKAHQKLFSIVGKLLALNEDATKQQHACREGVKYLKNYTFQHFLEEEAYMQSINYSGYEIHKGLHDNMRDNLLPALEKELEEQQYSVEAVQHFLGICVGWLNGHIMIEDHAITGRTSNKWIHQPSDDKIVSLEKAITQALQKLFRTEAKVISKRYSGEDFSSGNTLCYRLIYRSSANEQIQVFLLYEERMVLQTLSEICGKQISRTDKTVTYAMKVLSQQFLNCIGKHFQLLGTYQLEKNDLLTFEQLVRTFDKSYPPYSLLFSMDKKGYFAFCAKE